MNVFTGSNLFQTVPSSMQSTDSQTLDGTDPTTALSFTDLHSNADNILTAPGSVQVYRLQPKQKYRHTMPQNHAAEVKWLAQDIDIWWKVIY